MAEDKNGFLLYKDLIHSVRKLPKDKAGELFMHILSYVNDENPETDDLLIELSFEPVKQALKRDLKKYEKTKERNRENAFKRWNKSGESQSMPDDATAYDRIPMDAKGCEPMPHDAKHADIDSGSDNGNDSDIDILLEKETKEEISIEENFSETFSETKPIIPPAEDPPKNVPGKKGSGSKKKYFSAEDFKKVLLSLEADEKDADDWINVRRQKRAVFTENAIKLVQDECEKHGLEFKEAVKYSAKYGWQGFEYEWYLNKKEKENGKSISNTNNGSSNRSGNTSMGQGGKVSAASLLAERARKQNARNG